MFMYLPKTPEIPVMVEIKNELVKKEQTARCT